MKTISKLNRNDRNKIKVSELEHVWWPTTTEERMSDLKVIEIVESEVQKKKETEKTYSQTDREFKGCGIIGQCNISRCGVLRSTS